MAHEHTRVGWAHPFPARLARSGERRGSDATGNDQLQSRFVCGTIGPMLGSILPATVMSVEATGAEADPDLFLEEQQLVATSVISRQRAFASGRDCAHRALARLGRDPCPILHDGRGAPVWPADVVGSITHCDGYRVAAVAWKRDVACVGIDAEPNQDVSARVLRRVASADAHLMLREASSLEPWVSWGRLLFSAKEAVYKAWYASTGESVDFSELHLLFDVERAAFRARIGAARAATACSMVGLLGGRWRVKGGLLVTAVALTVGSSH